jgi:hypothetical protein
VVLWVEADLVVLSLFTHPNLRLDALHHSGSQLYRKNADSLRQGNIAR